VSDLDKTTIGHQVLVRDVWVLDASRFLGLSEVAIGGELLTSSPMLSRLNNEGRIVEASAYLSAEQIRGRIGVYAGGVPR
jgi:hypothetical protein